MRKAFFKDLIIVVIGSPIVFYILNQLFGGSADVMTYITVAVAAGIGWGFSQLVRKRK